MNLPILDQTKKNEQSLYGEAVRLSNEFRAVIAHTDIDTGLWIEAKWGFNCETANYTDFTTWLNDIAIKKSRSLFWFAIRIMTVRFPEKHTEIRTNLSNRRKFEFDFILSQMKNEWEWIGGVGYQNMVELNPDSPLNLKNIKVIKLSNDRVKTVRR